MEIATNEGAHEVAHEVASVVSRLSLGSLSDGEGEAATQQSGHVGSSSLSADPLCGTDEARLRRKTLS